MLAILLALPSFLGSLVVMYVLGTVLYQRAPWVIPVVWVLSGALLFAPPVESVISRLVLGTRRPTEGELRILAGPWQAVCRAAGVNGSRYALHIEESDELNAFAAGGRTVAVTRSALRLHPNHLEAILAHELGHHLAGHPVVSMLSLWYALPGRAATYLVKMAVRFTVFVGRIFATFGNGIGVLVSFMVALMLLFVLAVLSFWLILVPLTAPLLAWAGRLAEFRADRVAVSLGYRPALTELLHATMAMDKRVRPPGLRARMLATHPSHADRIKHL